ncbi:Uncharacterized protein FWK35_00022767 [Aphis craccivora]|uniref:Uncharacterized protein n=1 Tax=Aphis craccivora TaxID=307492 RepID=A0A6G0YH39_APHCR|nr:Uncharacterized protein FWK35_00022767 [Aphis craccivora]
MSNQRFLIWQRNKCLRRNAQMFEDIDKNKSSGYSSYLKDSEIKIKPPSIKTFIKTNKINSQNKFSISFPRVSTNENCQGLHLKFQKTLVNDKITSKLLEIIETQTDNQCSDEKYYKPLNKQFYDSKYYDKYMSTKNNVECTLINDKDLSFKPKILYLKPQHTHQVLKENRKKYRIDDESIFSELDKSVTLFQRLLRGRAYQIMMIMAKIRYQPILHSDEAPETLETSKKIKEITCADVLEYSRKKYISRFFDMLSNESIHIKYSENKNKMLIQQGNLSRIANEMVERKRRQIEITGRLEQDEILKQVLKIHEDVSILFCDKIMEEAIKQSAKEESLKAMMKSCKTKFYNIESEKNIEKELVSNFIIPEAHKVIMRESQSLN